MLLEDLGHFQWIGIFLASNHWMVYLVTAKAVLPHPMGNIVLPLRHLLVQTILTIRPADFPPQHLKCQQEHFDRTHHTRGKIILPRLFNIRKTYETRPNLLSSDQLGSIFNVQASVLSILAIYAHHIWNPRNLSSHCCSYTPQLFSFQNSQEWSFMVLPNHRPYPHCNITWMNASVTRLV